MTADVVEISCRPVGLDSLDRMDVDALVLAPFQDERPLRGAAGYSDWRLNGRLSRMILAGGFEARDREVLLTDTLGRIGTPRVFLFGQGERYAMDLTRFQRSVERVLQTLDRARMRSYAIELPGVDPGPVSVPQAISAFLEAAAGHPGTRVELLVPYPRFAELVSEIAAGERGVKILD